MNWRKLPNYTILIGHPVGPDDTWALELLQSLALGSNLRKYKFSVPNDLLQSHKHNVFEMVFLKLHIIIKYYGYCGVFKL